MCVCASIVKLNLRHTTAAKKNNVVRKNTKKLPASHGIVHNENGAVKGVALVFLRNWLPLFYTNNELNLSVGDIVRCAMFTFVRVNADGKG